MAKEKTGGTKSSSESARSAKTGQYVKKEYAEKHPSTTVVEKNKERNPKKK